MAGLVEPTSKLSVKEGVTAKKKADQKKQTSIVPTSNSYAYSPPASVAPVSYSVPPITATPGQGPAGVLSSTDIENEVRDLLELELGGAQRQLERQRADLIRQTGLDTEQAGMFQQTGAGAIDNAFSLGRGRNAEVLAQMMAGLQDSQNNRQGIGSREAATLSALDQIQQASFGRRQMDYETEGVQAAGDFQQDIASMLAEIQERQATGTSELDQLLGDLAQERGTLGSQLRREIGRESFDRSRMINNDLFDQSLAGAQLGLAGQQTNADIAAGNRDAGLNYQDFLERARQFDLSTEEGRRQFAAEMDLAERQFRNQEIQAEREAQGDLVGRPAMKDFLSRAGAPPETGDAFFDLVGATGGNQQAIEGLLNYIVNPGSVQDNPDTEVDEVLQMNEFLTNILDRNRGIGRMLTPENIPFLIDAMVYYYGGGG